MNVWDGRIRNWEGGHDGVARVSVGVREGSESESRRLDAPSQKRNSTKTTGTGAKLRIQKGQALLKRERRGERWGCEWRRTESSGDPKFWCVASVAAGLGTAWLFSEWRPLVLWLFNRFACFLSFVTVKVLNTGFTLLANWLRLVFYLYIFTISFILCGLDCGCLLVINFGPLLIHRQPLAAIYLSPATGIPFSYPGDSGHTDIASWRAPLSFSLSHGPRSISRCLALRVNPSNSSTPSPLPFAVSSIRRTRHPMSPATMKLIDNPWIPSRPFMRLTSICIISWITLYFGLCPQKQNSSLMIATRPEA